MPTLGVFACMTLLYPGLGRAVAADEIYDLKLGLPHGFASGTETAQVCRPDIVVWADTSSGYFYSRHDPQFEATPHGVFACLLPAMAADYWDKIPFSNVKEIGSSFPINPDLLCLA